MDTTKNLTLEAKNWLNSRVCFQVKKRKKIFLYNGKIVAPKVKWRTAVSL